MMDALFPSTLNPDSMVYLNQRWVRLADAQVSVLDRGFLFGDGIYEVVPVYGRRPLGWEGHAQRLRMSLEAISLAVPLGPSDWQDIVCKLIEQEVADDQFVYIQVTRGVAKRDHAFPRPAVSPTVFAMTTPFKRPNETERTQGVRAVSIPDLRWLRCDIKSISLLGNVLAREAAVSQGAQEAIQFRDGVLTEGGASNIWVVRDGALLSPPRSPLLLEGIRRSLLAELASGLGIEAQQRAISQAEVETADEILMTSATKEVLPIIALDGKPVGQGFPGPVYARLREAYDAAIRALAH